MYALNETPFQTSDFDQETQTYAVPAPKYSDPHWTPEPSKLTQEEIRELVAEWLG